MNEHNEVLLDGSRVIELKELHQRSTYEGLLEGRPTCEENAQTVAQIVANQLKRSGAVHLIEPAERVARDDPRAPGVKFGWLPRVTCIGRFDSAPREGQCSCGSELIIIWFQNSFSPSIAPEVLDEVRKVRWEILAEDYDV